MTNLKLALDWTPNTNHIGFFIAQELGFYQQKGIQLEISNPQQDNYALTPGKKLDLDLVDFAIAPFETVISLNNKKNPLAAKAIFAILQDDISSIASLVEANIERPKHLDNKIYASYKARYEDHIVKQLVKNDEGKGAIEITYPEKLGIWNTLLKGKADATWIFDNWEGIEAETQGLTLNRFRMKRYNIPYCYSPVIVASNKNILAKQEAYKAFVQGTKEGFLYVKDHLEEAAAILKKHLTDYDKKHIDLQASITYTIPYFGTKSNCGFMEKERVENFLEWLVKHQLESEQILKQDLFTNDLMKA